MAERRHQDDRRTGGDRRKALRREPERTEELTHQENRENARLAHLNPYWRAIALKAVVCLVVVLIGASIALTVALLQKDTALDRANQALQQASAALQGFRQQEQVLVAQQAAQHRQLLEGCERLNVQRAESNANVQALYLLLLTARAGGAAQPRLPTSAQRRAQHAFGRVLGRSIVSVSWTPLTNCGAAVALSGPAYRAPHPVLFVAQRPPASALDPVNADKVTPVGSTL